MTTRGIVNSRDRSAVPLHSGCADELRPAHEQSKRLTAGRDLRGDQSRNLRCRIICSAAASADRQKCERHCEQRCVSPARWFSGCTPQHEIATVHSSCTSFPAKHGRVETSFESGCDIWFKEVNWIGAVPRRRRRRSFARRGSDSRENCLSRTRESGPRRQRFATSLLKRNKIDSTPARSPSTRIRK